MSDTLLITTMLPGGHAAPLSSLAHRTTQYLSGIWGKLRMEEAILGIWGKLWMDEVMSVIWGKL